MWSRRAMRMGAAAMAVAIGLAGCGPSHRSAANAPRHTAAKTGKSSASGATPAAPIVPAYLDMRSAQAGWGTGPGVYITADGGGRWTAVTPPDANAQWPTFPDQIATPDAQTAWVVGQLAQGIVLYRTTDAGAHWQQVRLPAVNVRFNGLHFTGYTGAAIAATSGQDAWLFLILAQAAGTEYAATYQTTNGGSSWTALGNWTGGDTTAIGVQSPTSLWLGQYTAVTTNTAAVSHTSNAGRTWQPVALPIPKADQHTFYGTLQPLFFSAQDGVIPILPGLTPAVLVFDSTQDGGRTWTTSTPVVVHTIRQVYGFADAQHGWVATGEELLATSDGGQSWHAVVPHSRAPAPQDVRQLDFVSPTTGWAVASQSGGIQLWETQDGGRDWSELGSQR